jgi:hypothetical protein
VATVLLMFSLICTVPLPELADVMHYISPEHSTLCSHALAMLIRVSSQHQLSDVVALVALGLSVCSIMKVMMSDNYCKQLFQHT